MTPGNYCVHAIEDLSGVLRWLKTKRGAQADAEHLELMINSLAKAEKFLLPVNGRLLDDDAMPSEEIIKNLKLPFEAIAVEFPNDHTGPVQEIDQQVASSKRIVYCLEDQNLDGYWVTTIDYLDNTRHWQLCPVMNLIPYHLVLEPMAIDVLDKHAQRYVPDSRRNGTVDTFKIRTQTTMPWVVERTCRMTGIDVSDFLNSSIAEVSSDWRAVVDLTNVLHCQNTTTEKVDPPAKLNAKRIKLGKIPYDSYHVLKIKTDRSSGPRANAGGTHGSPRQHIRRGHIRTYHRGMPNQHTIFIKQMLVGDPSKGKVRKDYEIVR